MQIAGVDDSQPGIKIAGRNINNLRYADYTTLITKCGELKSLLMRVKEESENAALKLTIQKTKIMQSFHSKEMGEKWKQWQILFPWALKSLQTVTAAMKLKYACSLKEKL